MHRHIVTMVAIQVYKISTAKNGKLPKHSEIVQEQEINPNGFAYARDMPKDEQNYSWYVVGEDEHLTLLTIEDLVVEKDGTMLYLPVIPSLSCSLLACRYVRMHTSDCYAGVFVQANPSV